MAVQDFLYHNQVQVYLQGLNALEVDQTAPDHLSCYLGSQSTRIKIRDFRRASIEAAEKSLQTQNTTRFAEIFNRPALAKICARNGRVQIDMHECNSGNPEKMLWIGVVEDGEPLPLYYADWELYKPLNGHRTGFASLVSK